MKRRVYSLDTAKAGATPQAVQRDADKRPDTVLLLPVGLHNMLSVLDDLMERRDYVYRQGSNTAVVRVAENAPRGYFYAPGQTRRSLRAVPGDRFLQSSNLAVFSPGDDAMSTSEDDGRTYREAQSDGKLTSVFAERGGTSVVSDEEGNVYIASGQIYVYDRQGKQIGVLELPERPGSLAFGGPDKRTLFIGARSSLYAIRTASPSQSTTDAPASGMVELRRLARGRR